MYENCYYLVITAILYYIILAIMGNTCTSQMYQVDKKVPKRQTVQLVTEN
jgi:hypothetical protein